VAQRLTRTDSMERLFGGLTGGVSRQSSLSLVGSKAPGEGPASLKRTGSYLGLLDGMLSRENSKDLIGVAAEKQASEAGKGSPGLLSLSRQLSRGISSGGAGPGRAISIDLGGLADWEVAAVQSNPNPNPNPNIRASA
jgi:hypothetical protein